MAGYYQTPNKMIPLNDRPAGEIADIAKQQLKPYHDAAYNWQTYTDGRCNRCTECHQNIWFSKDPQGHEYQYSLDEILALTVAHIRQVHNDRITQE
jgi:hypothetical protein